MLWRALAEVVLVLHLAFIVFVGIGPILAWRWLWLVWLHVPAALWAVGIVTVGWICPLTPLEKWLRREGGGEGYEGGFIDRYIEDVIYPEELTPVLRLLVVALVVIGYVGLARRHAQTPRAGAAT